MAKAVLISIRPEWVNKIMSGEKTLEVRKTKPKLKTPFKCYIYCTNSGVAMGMFGKHGKVVGEFVCDKIDNIWKRGIPENFDYCYLPLNEWGNDDIETEIRDIRESCIPKEKLNAYAGKMPVLYAWHISGLKIYGNPKKLGEFSPLFENCKGKVCDEFGCASCENGGHIKRPPQSWCYVEEQRWPYVNLL